MTKIAMMLLGITLIPAGFSLQAKAQQESYTAILAAPNSGASQSRFNVRITKWASDDQVKEFGKILKEQGQDALVSAL